MTIKWMQHSLHGKFPCTSADIELFKKAGWEEIQEKVISNKSIVIEEPKESFIEEKRPRGRPRFK